MMPVVRISDNTWERLKKRAIPLEDSLDDVIGKVLEMADEHDLCSDHRKIIMAANMKSESVEIPRIRRHKRVPEEAYFDPIMKTIYDMGGKGRVKEILDEVGRKVQHVLSDIDREPVKTGDVRWRNSARWARNKLIKKGYLRTNTPRGIWELSEQGIKEVERRLI